MLKKIQILLLFSIMISLPSGSFGQEKNYVDSILKVIQVTGNDTLKGYRYIDISVATVTSNPFIAKLYASKALDIFERQANSEGIARACLKIANSCRLLNEEANMLRNMKMALSLAEQLHDPELLSNCYHEMALIANEQNDLEKSLSYNLKAIELRKEIKNDKEIAGLYNNIGIIYAKKNDWVNGLRYFRMSYEFEKRYGNNLSRGNALNNIGIYFIYKKQYDSAAYFLNEGKKLRTRSNDIQGLAGSYNNISLMNLELNKISEAILYADTAYKLAKQVNVKSSELEVLLTYYSIYDKKKDYKNALEYYREAENIRKSIESESNKRKLSEVQASIDLELKEKELLQATLELKDANAEKRTRNLALVLSLGGLGLCAFVIWFVIKANKKVNLANKLVKEQKKRVEEQKTIIEEKHKDITDSIFYAQKIQESLIIPEAQLKKSLPESFVLYAPRDIVSGDFYWYGERDGFKILAVADCTGHGVPGAFMSLIGISSLNQVVLERGLTSPAKILDLLREKVIQSLNQNNEDSHRKDGMDISVIALKNNELIYAGANNPCIILRNKEIISLEPNKQPVGFHEQATAFFEKKTELQKGDLIYLFTDGIVDQFGGEKGKKLKIKYFKEWLIECSALEMPKQKEFIQKKLNNWKRNLDQTDDILITGVQC